MNELDLFAKAIELADPSERAALLDRECSGKPALRERMDQLLAAHEKSHGLLDRPPYESETLDGSPATSAARTLAGVVIAGRYKLLEQIGDGGMGTVWMAEQRAPVKRMVAVKLIKAGMDSKSVLARFEAERQALALMDHPNIAKVLDAGTDDSGRPYFVMELVKGLSLTEYCDSRRLSVKDRLELFVQICSAIQHAHQKAVIHRDLKPSNVLVTEHDGKPVPKVIDFGLAKAMGATNTLTEKTLHTAYGTVVGTPLYMAPEQVGINALDVDTRTDIYSLGVILYELLTGSTPLERARFKEAAWEEVKRLIREEEPPRPSIRLSSAQTLPSLAASRQIEPAQLRRMVRGELDWIVMKALEKDRSRRYETANGLARDILRYLSDEAVEACPPSATYRLRKFTRRYRAPLTTAAVIAVLLTGGIVVSTWQAVRATRAEANSRASAASERLANLEAQKSAAAEKQANEQSQKRLAQLEKGNEILTSIFDDLDVRVMREGNEPLEAVLARRLVKAANQLEGDAVGDPLAVAELQYRIAAPLMTLGHLQEATDLYTKAHDTFAARLGPDHLDTLKTARMIGECENSARKYEVAMPLWEDTLKRAKAALESDHDLTLLILGGQATCYMGSNKYDLALPMVEEITALFRAKKGADHFDTLNSMNNLALCYRETGNLDKALATYEEVLKLQNARGAAEHPDKIQWMFNLAGCYAQERKFDQALPMLEEVVRRRKAKLGADHPDTLNATSILGSVYIEAGKTDLALPLLEECLQLSKARLGPDHPATLRTMTFLGQGYYSVRKFDLALPLLEHNLKTQRASLGTNLPEVWITMNSVGVCCWKMHLYDKSIPIFEELVAIQEKKLGRGGPDTLRSIANLGVNYREAGRLSEAIPLLEEAYRASKQKPFLDFTGKELIRALVPAGKFDAAEKAMDEQLAELGTQSPGRSPGERLFWASVLNSIASGRNNAGRFAEAESLFRRSLAIQQKDTPDDWSTFNTMSGVGMALLRQKKYSDAETMLRTSYEGLEQRKSTIPNDVGADEIISHIVDRLIELSVATGKTEAAVKWIDEEIQDARTRLPPGSLQLAAKWAEISVVLLKLKRFDDAEPLLREALAIRQKNAPDVWTTFTSMSMLGDVLLHQKKYADAEPLLIKGYEGMKQRDPTIPKHHGGELRIPQALDRLIEFSIAINNADDVKKWRAERAKYPGATTQPGKK